MPDTLKITPHAKGLVQYALTSELHDWNTETKQEASRLYMLTVNFPTVEAGLLLGVIRGTHQFTFSPIGDYVTGILEVN
jgi:hypothetical protein